MLEQSHEVVNFIWNLLLYDRMHAIVIGKRVHSYSGKMFFNPTCC